MKLDRAVTLLPHGVGGSQVDFWMPLGYLSIKAFRVKKSDPGQAFFFTDPGGACTGFECPSRQALPKIGQKGVKKVSASGVARGVRPGGG